LGSFSARHQLVDGDRPQRYFDEIPTTRQNVRRPGSQRVVSLDLDEHVPLISPDADVQGFDRTTEIVERDVLTENLEVAGERLERVDVGALDRRPGFRPHRERQGHEPDIGADIEDDVVLVQLRQERTRLLLVAAHEVAHSLVSAAQVEAE
jgi:hypothetical protein